MEIQLFNNPQFGNIRTAGTPDNPEFCLSDVCSALKLDTANVRRRLSDGVCAVHPTVDALGRTQSNTYINEDGLYDVILDSRKPEARAFRKWITSEVIPSIRKTGSYSVQNLSRKELALMVIKQEEEKEALMLENKRKEEMLEEQKPKVLFADAVATAKQSCLIGELAKIICQNGVNIGQNRLFNWLRDHGYLGKYGQYYNIPTQMAMDMNLFEIKKNTVVKPDGSVLVTTTTKVTGKGQQYFINKFLGNGNKEN